MMKTMLARIAMIFPVTSLSATAIEPPMIPPGKTVGEPGLQMIA